MPRLIAPNGATVSVSDEKAERLLSQGFKAPGAAAESEKSGKAEGYNALKVADLRAEIEKRNEGREEDAALSTEGKKVDLVAALEADDAAASGSGDGDETE